MRTALMAIFDSYAHSLPAASALLSTRCLRARASVSKSMSTPCAARARGCRGSQRLLKKHGVGATFYFSVGPDHTGRAMRRVFRKGFAQKVARTSVLKHYGLKTLMYGVLLPGPDIGREAGEEMRRVRDAGFEVGLHTYDHVRWQDTVAGADAAWTRTEMERGIARLRARVRRPRRARMPRPAGRSTAHGAGARARIRTSVRERYPGRRRVPAPARRRPEHLSADPDDAADLR